MAAGLGKKFENVFKLGWKKSFPNTFIYRIPDQWNGMKTTSQNPCDFLAANNGVLWMLECKETQDGTINFSKIPQMDRMKDYVGLKGVYPYIIVWFSSYDKVIATHVEEALRMQADGKKSISLKMLGEGTYNILELPSEKRRVFLDTDYTAMLSVIKEEDKPYGQKA